MENKKFQKVSIVSEFTQDGKRRISASGISTYADAPAKYWGRYINPNRPPEKSTTAKDFGREFHLFMENESKFWETHAIMPKFDMRTNAGKSDRAMWDLENAGKTGITQDQSDEFKQMKASFEASNFGQLLLMAKPEIYSELKFESTTDGQFIQGTRGILDQLIIINNVMVIHDFKSTTSCHPDDVARDCEKFGYYEKAAFYLDQFPEVRSVVYTFIEKSYPYICHNWEITRENEAGKKGFAILNYAMTGLLSDLENMGSELQPWGGYVLEKEISDLPVGKWSKRMKGGHVL